MLGSMDSWEEQSFQLLSVILCVQRDDELEEKGGGQSRPLSSSPTPSQLQQQLVSKLLSCEPKNSELLKNIVPSHLPDNLKANIPEVTYQTLSELYDIEASSQLVADGRLSIPDLVSSYLHSFRNMYEYELSDQSTFHLRFLKYFSRLFAEMTEQICKDASGTNSNKDKSLVCVLTR